MNNLSTDQVNSEQAICAGGSLATRPPLKIELNLFYFLKQGPAGLNQPEAHRFYGESCLHTSVSSLKNKGVSLIAFRDLDTIRHFNQKPFNRYWLARDCDRRKAQSLLNHYRNKRGLDSLEFAPWHDTNKKSA